MCWDWILVIQSSMYSSLTRCSSFSGILNFLAWLNFQPISYRSASSTQDVHSWNRRTFRPPDLPQSSYFCRCHTLCSHLLQTKFLLDELKESSIFHFPQLLHFFEVFVMKIGRPSGLPFDLLVLIVLCPLLNSRDGDRVICSTHVFLLVFGYWCKTLAWLFCLQ